jgi:type VI protein secretion system component Hcp
VPPKRIRDDRERPPVERPPVRAEPLPDRDEPETLVHRTLDLQQRVGNTVVTGILARSPLQRDPDKTKPPPKTEESGGTTYTLAVEGIGTFEVSSFSWGVTNPGTTGGVGKGKDDGPKDLHFTKKVDKHSTALAEANATGRTIGKVELRVTSGKSSHTITLNDVFVSSFQTGGTAGSGAEPTDQFTLNAASIEFKHDKDDKKQGEGAQSTEGAAAPYPG